MCFNSFFNLATATAGLNFFKEIKKMLLLVLAALLAIVALAFVIVNVFFKKEGLTIAVFGLVIIAVILTLLFLFL